MKFALTFIIATLLLTGCEEPQENSAVADKPVVRFADFDYLGAFAPPKEAVDNSQGGKWSTGYGSGGLALRRVGGTKQFFATTHVYSGGLVYEMSYPGVSKTEPYPQAAVVREWGDLYGGRKQTHEGSALGGGVLTHGLYWDEERERLYWSYGHLYNVAQANNPVLGFASFSDTETTAQGPWKSTAGGAHSQRLRGGVLRIPDGFAERYTDGKTLGIGFGGYYSGVASASQGPALYATADPEREGEDLETQALLAFSDGACGTVTAENAARCKAVRSGDYRRSPAGPIAWDIDPVAGQGYWTAADTVEGAAVWIDLPRTHGLLFFPTLGQGEICYCEGAITAESYASYWYSYDPADLARVARGVLEPYQVDPDTMTRVTYPAGTRVTGAVFDAEEEVLYLYVYEAYRDGPALYPLIYAYRLNP